MLRYQRSREDQVTQDQSEMFRRHPVDSDNEDANEYPKETFRNVSFSLSSFTSLELLRRLT